MGTLGQPQENFQEESENFVGVRFSNFKDRLIGDSDITETLPEFSWDL